MRFIYIILLGLIIFNGTLILFSPLFPDAVEDSAAVDVFDDDGVGGYGNIGTNLFKSMFSVSNMLVVSGIFGIGVLLSLVSRNPTIGVGIGLFAAVIGGLWNATSRVIFGLTDYPIVSGISTLLTIVIGVILVFTVLEMLTGQGRSV